MTVAHPSDSKARAIQLYKRRRLELDRLEAEAAAIRKRHSQLVEEYIPTIKNALDMQLQNVATALDREAREDEERCSN